MATTTASDAIITLTTDFGLSDPYVAAMKGVILSLNPHAIIVDITHEVRPQQVLQATFVTQAAWPHFPLGAIHAVIVDPGVGTARRAVALETPRGCFLGPDNGALSAALPDEVRPARTPKSTVLPPGYRAYAITEPRYMLRPVSATFHGRDVFAPAAAHLSLGLPLGELGERLDAILALPPLQAHRAPDGALLGQVVHLDRFGNVITDVRAEDLPAKEFIVELGGRRVAGLVRTYAEATVLSALVGSSGLLELALWNGNAARELGVDIGDAAVLRPA